MPVPAMLLAGWKLLQGGLYATALASFIYEMYQGANDPNVDLAETIKASQKKQVQAAARRMATREGIETEFSMARTRRNQRLLSTKLGLERGFVSPVELGIRGGGYAARDVPLIRQVAAQVGMDPEDLAARFDPTRAGPYTPPSKQIGV
jgi:hypothetical protein